MCGVGLRWVNGGCEVGGAGGVGVVGWCLGARVVGVGFSVDLHGLRFPCCGEAFLVVGCG